MKLYEIEREIQSVLDEVRIDEETGEILELDFDKLDKLNLAKEEKIENIALAFKNYSADAAAYKAEKEAFAEKEKAAKNKAENIKKYLSFILAGDTFKTAKIDVRYRRSESVEIEDGTELPDEYKKIKVEPDKTAIKKALKEGTVITGCSLKENSNIQIK